ncbi:DUF262 domain-containing protein [bacterium]|nr:DUF262 domain-containing protein [bacterium]
MAYQSECIYTILRKIRAGKYVLPAIQREFVWNEDRIYNLLDSIVRKYPFGNMLFWETKPEKYRKFSEKYHSEDDLYYFMEVNTTQTTRTLVLDGQQRLQSLYLSTFGTYDNKLLYFDVFSNPERETSERRYEFEFLKPAEIESINIAAKTFTYENIDAFDYYVSFQQILESSSLVELRKSIISKMKVDIEGEWNEDIEILVEKNLESVRDAFKNTLHLSYFEVSDADIEGLSEDDILEIFVRVNSGGMQLSRSDLMFSIIALKMERDPWEMFGELLRKLKRKYSSFDFNKDFIIKCFLVIHGLGARYEIKKLRSKENIKAFEEKFDRIGESIMSCMDFITSTVKIQCDGILGSYNALIPLIYWIYHQKGHPSIPISEVSKMKYFFYIALFTRSLSRYADSRIDRLNRWFWKDINSSFPLEASLNFIKEVEGSIPEISELLSYNLDLTLNILHNGVVLDPGFEGNKPERDHIFPKSLLKDHYPPELVNHYANFWFIPKTMNRNKSNIPPEKYFEKERAFNCKNKELERKLKNHLVLPRNLDLEIFISGKKKDFPYYEDFINARKKMIVKKAKKFLKY